MIFIFMGLKKQDFDDSKKPKPKSHNQQSQSQDFHGNPLSTYQHPYKLGLGVSQPHVVRSEHVRTLFVSTQS